MVYTGDKALENSKHCKCVHTCLKTSTDRGPLCRFYSWGVAPNPILRSESCGEKKTKYTVKTDGY